MVVGGVSTLKLIRARAFVIFSAKCEKMVFPDGSTFKKFSVFVTENIY